MSAPEQRRELALEALLEGKSHEESARLAGVTSRTIRRWLADPDFEADLKRRTGALIGGFRRRLLAEVEASLRTLVELRDDPNTSDSVRKGCAESIMDRAGVVKASEVAVTFEDRRPPADEDVAAWLAEQAAENEPEPA